MESITQVTLQSNTCTARKMGHNKQNIKSFELKRKITTLQKQKNHNFATPTSQSFK